MDDTIEIVEQAPEVISLLEANDDTHVTVVEENLVVTGEVVSEIVETVDPTPITITELGAQGPKGDTGAVGAQGEQGDTGIGVPTGGTTGQVLTKKTNADYDTEWEDVEGGVTSVFGRTGAVTAQTGDYTTAQVTEITNLYFTNARAVTALTGQNVSLFVNDAGYVQSSRTLSTTAPLSGGGDLSANRTLSIADAAADGTTKGAATFNASDFNSASGVISIDYTNGQAASAGTKGFLTAADWTTFNGKFNLPALTSGSLLFSNGSTIAQDNANLFWDDTNNRLGIGTASPSKVLHVADSTKGFMTFEGNIGSGVYSGGALLSVSVGASSGAQAGAYMSFAGKFEAWIGVQATNNAAGYKYMRFGNSTNNVIDTTNGTFAIQRLNDAATAVSATPFQMSNAAPSSSLIITSVGNVGFGAGTTPSARIHAIATTEQLRVGYNASNYYSTTVGSTGGVTFDAVGSGAGFTFSDRVINNSTVRLKNYTVATLPAGTQGDMAYVTDALAPTYLTAVVGGGAVVCPVFYNGTNWVAH